MTDLLTDALPTVWEGRRIDPDFRHMVWLLNTYRRAETDEEKVQLMRDAAERFFAEPVSDPQLPDAFASLMRFFRGCADDAPGGEPPEADAGAGEITLDYHCDAAYVLGAFQQAYGIDLTIDKVHWWRFMALMQALPQETALSQILQIRTTDTSEMEEHQEGHPDRRGRCHQDPCQRAEKRRSGTAGLLGSFLLLAGVHE